MQTTVKRLDLLEALGRVQPGLSKRAFIEQSSCYVFKDGWVICFNDEICCRTKSGLSDDFTGAVHAKPLTDVLNNMSAEEIIVKPTEKKLVLKHGKATIELRMEQEIVLPVDEVSIPAKDDWRMIPENFIEAIKLVSEAAATTDEEFLPQCVHVHTDWIEASDRRQMHRYTLDTGATEPFLVRAKSIAPMVKLDVVKMAETREWAHFRNKTLVYSCRRHLEEYFNLTKTFELAKGTPAILPSGGEEAAKIAGTFAEGKDNDKVTVTLSEGQMLVVGEGPFGKATIPLAMNYKGAEATFRTLPAMLVNLIKSYKDVELAPGKMIVRGENWTYVVGLGKKTGEADAPKPEETTDGEE